MPTLSWTRALVIPTALLLATAMSSAQSDFVLSTTGGTGAPGDSVPSVVTLDNTGTDYLAGWSYGICHDPAHVQLDGAEYGSTTESVNGGGPPDFGQINLFTDGYTLGVVISFLGLQTLPPGTGYELTVADYTLIGSAGTSSTITPCSTLGSPPVASVVVVGTASIPVDAVPTTIEILDVQPLEYSISAAALYFDDDGVGARTVTVRLADPESPSRETLGLAFGLALDNTLVVATGTRAAGVLAGLGGGLGPEYYGEVVTSDGVTVGALYSLLLLESVTFGPGATAIVEVDLETVAPSFSGTAVGTTTGLAFAEDLGDPPVGVGVFVGQSFEAAAAIDATLSIEPLPDLAIFRSGDANDDGAMDIADGQFILAYLFAGGIAPPCPAAADTDGNGNLEIADPIRILESLFSGGASPEDPFPNCGPRAGILPGDCTYSSCP